MLPTYGWFHGVCVCVCVCVYENLLGTFYNMTLGVCKIISHVSMVLFCLQKDHESICYS